MKRLENILVQEFSEADKAQIPIFEAKLAVAMGEEFPLTQITACVKYYEDFSTHHKQFDAFKIFIAKDTVTSQIVGIVNGVVKTVDVERQPIKIAQIFGLKVLKEYRRRGIAITLCQELEKALEAMDVTCIFVKIDSTNQTAQSLYNNKLNYCEAFSQRIKIIPSSQTNSRLKLLSKENAFTQTKNYYNEDGFSLTSLWEMFNSPNYLGTYIVEGNKEQILGISLWNTSVYPEMSLNKVIINTDTLKQPPVYFLCCLGLVLLSFLTLYVAFSIFFMINTIVLKVIYLAAACIICVKVFVAVYHLFKYGKTAINETRKQRGRVFGQFYVGKGETRKEMFLELIEGLKQEAYAHNLEYIFFEYHLNNPVASVFHVHDISRIYLQKPINRGQELNWKGNYFLDPRD